ncbi:MAG: hypothetical protein JST12_00255 [Armatimonadetes bacterium]|nr:hypothetical protein [Armatimonadota bacterium]
MKKGQYVASSIVLSPNLERYSYTTKDGKVIVDGKSYGPYVGTGVPTFSGDSKQWGMLAQIKKDEAPKLILDGVPKDTEAPPSSVFRGGIHGPICWIERSDEHARLVTPDETTAWFEKIEKLDFSDDGLLFYMRTSEKIKKDKDAPKDDNSPSSRDYIVYKGGKRVPRERVLQVYIAPNNGGFAALAIDDTMVFKGQTAKVHGHVYGDPQFSPDGKHFAFRTEFTEVVNQINTQRYQYVIDEQPIEGLQIQSGLTYSDDSLRWVMCGLNGKKPYLYLSDRGLMAYEDVVGLGGVTDLYKQAKFVNGKLILLFQPRRSKPLLYVEDKGVAEIGPFMSIPETFSVSPDGKYVAVAGFQGQATHAYVYAVGGLAKAEDAMKGDYDLQNLGAGTFVWSGNHQLSFAILRRNDLIHVSLDP